MWATATKLPSSHFKTNCNVSIYNGGRHCNSSDLLRSWMSAVDQVLAEVDTDGKVLISCINLSLETLMVVH